MLTNFFNVLTCLVRDLIVLLDLELDTNFTSSVPFFVFPFF